MKTVLLYRPDSPHERQALDYMRDFAMQTGKTLPALNPDSPEGAQLCQLYDIVQYPAILVTDDTGHLQNLWLGDNLPSFGEIGYYVETPRAQPGSL